MSLTKLRKAGTPGVYIWKIELSSPEKRIHTHVELTEVQAQKMYADLLEARARQKLGLPYSHPLGDHTIEDAAAKYELDMLNSDKNHDHVSGVLLSLKVLKEVLARNDYPVRQIRPEHIRAWRDRRKSTPCVDKFHKGKIPGPRTINKGIGHLSAFFNWCCTQEWMDSNPAEHIAKVKQAPSPLRVLSWVDYCKFADAAWYHWHPYFGLLVEILGESGARIDNLLRAKKTDVDVKGRTWRAIVKPGNKLLEMEAGPWMLAAARLETESEYLCPMEDGSPFTYQVVRKAFASISKVVGFANDITPHYIRHGRACWDLAEGKTVWQVKEKLGHSTVTVTEGYLKAARAVRNAEPPGTVHTRPCELMCELGMD
jgi:integrase